jgi:hypothetical protein
MSETTPPTAERQATTKEPQTELVIGRTRYALVKRDHATVPYELRGVRGAIYGLMRNQNTPHMMFPIDGRGFGPASALRNMWFSDASGVVEVVR